MRENPDSDTKMSKFKSEVTPSISKLGKTTMQLYPIYFRNMNEDEYGNPIKVKKPRLERNDNDSDSSDNSFDK